MDRVISAWLILLLGFLQLVKLSANVEGDALNALKSNLADPNNVLQSWDPTLVNPCTWFHVTCNSENSVTRVDLGNANLSSNLVTQLGVLTNLQYLELYSNNITGSIPDELGNLNNLVSLDLYLNKLDGDIPDTLGNLGKLRFLRLNNNTLTGKIPNALTKITSLQVLDLSNNNLTGDIPVNGSFSLFTPISFANNPNPNPLPVTPPPPVSPNPPSSYSEAYISQADVMREYLDCFCANFGQEVSYEKFRPFCSPNIEMDLANQLSDICGYPLTNDLGIYLGVPLSHPEFTPILY